MMEFLERRRPLVVLALRLALGWHLAYLGVWALTSSWSYSWAGPFRCAHWIGGALFRAIGQSAAMGAVDAVLAWGLLVAGVLLVFGRAVAAAGAFGILYYALMYLLNPPHFGHTGDSHFLFIDRNVVEVFLLGFVMAVRGRGPKGGEAQA